MPNQPVLLVANPLTPCPARALTCACPCRPQSLSLSGAYPASSVQHMLHTLLLVVRDPEPAAWAAKLALLSYFLMDAGALEAAAPGGAGAAAGLGPGSAAGGGGEARVEAALEELRRTFRLSAADVGVWQCNYLLDCAVPGACARAPVGGDLEPARPAAAGRGGTA